MLDSAFVKSSQMLKWDLHGLVAVVSDVWGAAHLFLIASPGLN